MITAIGWLFSRNPLALLSGGLAIGWAATVVFGLGWHKLELYAAVSKTRTDTIAIERQAADERLRKTVAVINGHADKSVLEGQEARALAPILKTIDEVAARCAVSKFCRDNWKDH